MIPCSGQSDKRQFKSAEGGHHGHTPERSDKVNRSPRHPNIGRKNRNKCHVGARLMDKPFKTGKELNVKLRLQSGRGNYSWKHKFQYRQATASLTVIGITYTDGGKILTPPIS